MPKHVPKLDLVLVEWVDLIAGGKDVAVVSLKTGKVLMSVSGAIENVNSALPKIQIEDMDFVLLADDEKELEKWLNWENVPALLLRKKFDLQSKLKAPDWGVVQVL